MIRLDIDCIQNSEVLIFRKNYLAAGKIGPTGLGLKDTPGILLVYILSALALKFM